MPLLILAWLLSTKALHVPAACLGSGFLEVQADGELVGDRWDQKGAQEPPWSSLLLSTEDGGTHCRQLTQAQWVREPWGQAGLLQVSTECADEVSWPAFKSLCYPHQGAAHTHSEDSWISDRQAGRLGQWRRCSWGHWSILMMLSQPPSAWIPQKGCSQSSVNLLV